MGWAGWGNWAGSGKQVSGPGGLSPLFFYFVSLFYFCSFVSDLVIAQIILINPANNCGH